MSATALLRLCTFPPAGTAVDLAVSGGPDSTGLLLLALEAGLEVTVHHVDHHARPDSGQDAAFVRDLSATRGIAFVGHDVAVEPGPNFEQRARRARRACLPSGALTGHTMDDVAETILLNFFRGAGLTGLTPMHNDLTKPLRHVRRSELHAYVAAAGVVARTDPSNLDPRYRRNRIRHELLPLLADIMERDVAPILHRQADVMFDDRQWLDQVTAVDHQLDLERADCRKLAMWPTARLRHWLRRVLALTSPDGDTYAPSIEEITRAIAVVRGEVVACELAGGRRLARRQQQLTLSE